MPPIIQIEKIVEPLEFQLDEYSSYLDLDSGEVETLPRRFAQRCRRS
jgi:hypothetical protein